MQPRSLRIIATIPVVAAAAAALFGCASTCGRDCATSSAASSPETAAALPGKAACFRVADFDGTWITLSNSELIVPDPVFSRRYLIELREPVYDLKLRHRLGFEAFTPADGCICNGFSDYLLAARSGLAGHVPIVAVRQLTEAQERQLLSKYHIRLPAWRPATAPGHPGNGCPLP